MVELEEQASATVVNSVPGKGFGLDMSFQNT